MSEARHAFLSLGSNIGPENNLRKAIELLKQEHRLTGISSAWENHAVGAPGAPNFLNACVSLETSLNPREFLEQVIRPIEDELGRARTKDKFSARPIDIDVILHAGQPLRLEYWQHAFMIVPLSELIPDFIDPISNKPLSKSAEEALKREWMLKRPEVLAGVEIK